tara:strand:+ start:66 stop:230 length:165 start_codon:yes stop_codon:yes gene_type:complete
MFILNLFIDFLNLYYSLPTFPQKTAICGVFGYKEIDISQRYSPTDAITAGRKYV